MNDKGTKSKWSETASMNKVGRLVVVLLAVVVAAGCNLQRDQQYVISERTFDLTIYAAFGTVATEELVYLYRETCSGDLACFQSQVAYLFSGQFGAIDNQLLVDLLAGNVDPAVGPNLNPRELESTLNNPDIIGRCLYISQRDFSNGRFYGVSDTPRNDGGAFSITCLDGASTGLPSGPG
jgi:hypothetical protein